MGWTIGTCLEFVAVAALRSVFDLRPCARKRDRSDRHLNVKEKEAFMLSNHANYYGTLTQRHRHVGEKSVSKDQCRHHFIYSYIS